MTNNSTADYLVSCDAGNGFTNAVMYLGNGKFKSYGAPSVRAAATGDTLGFADELQYGYCDWNGFRYVVGDDVVRITRSAIERHSGINRYGNELHQFLIAHAVANLGVKSGTVDLVVFAPPGMYNDVKATITNALLDDGGRVTIKLKGDKTAREWRYVNVSVYPEGLGAAACFLLDGNGNVADGSALAGDVLILDGGAHTLDALLLRNGSFNPETLQHATYDNGGLHAHIHDPILRSLKKHSDDFAPVTIDDVDFAIRKGQASGDYSIQSGATVVTSKSFEDMLKKHSERHAEWAANNVIDGRFNGLRGVRALIQTGGWQPLTVPHFQKWYADKLLDSKKLSKVKLTHTGDMNAMGGALLRIAALNAPKPKPRK